MGDKSLRGKSEFRLEREKGIKNAKTIDGMSKSEKEYGGEGTPFFTTTVFEPARPRDSVPQRKNLWWFVWHGVARHSMTFLCIKQKKHESLNTAKAKALP